MKKQRPEVDERMKKAINALISEYHTIRAGRANASILDKVSVDYYGCMTPVNQMAAVSVSDARTLTISPYDATSLSSIEKAIQIADIGINPQNDGKVIRLSFPPLTEERRKELVKDVKAIAENSKVAVRNIRRDAMEAFKLQKKNSEITEDELKIAEDDVQELTDKYIKEIDKTAQLKEKEILEI